MAEENVDGAVKWLMKRLMETSAETFELAFARYETSEREAALAQARRLMDSDDPAEKELGLRLKAEVLKEHRDTSGHMLEAPGGNGVVHDPLLHSPFPSSGVAALPSREARTEETAESLEGEAVPRKQPDPGEPSSRSSEGPPKRPRGRPKLEKNLQLGPPRHKKAKKPKS